MTDLMKGKIKQEPTVSNLFETEATSGFQGNTPLQFLAEATAMFDAGRALWKY
jgi:hypothetical protein